MKLYYKLICNAVLVVVTYSSIFFYVEFTFAIYIILWFVRKIKLKDVLEKASTEQGIP